ncbi:hypothetical protein K474DRAFT_1408425 [Panus rudis PR-1116 ss-1]|nr:hypothetical protein K474DRAFT_1408425 [Panus rudis PR-1116 ss-1]
MGIPWHSCPTHTGDLRAVSLLCMGVIMAIGMIMHNRKFGLLGKKRRSLQFKMLMMIIHMHGSTTYSEGYDICRRFKKKGTAMAAFRLATVHSLVTPRHLEVRQT